MYILGSILLGLVVIGTALLIIVPITTKRRKKKIQSYIEVEYPKLKDEILTCWVKGDSIRELYFLNQNPHGKGLFDVEFKYGADAFVYFDEDTDTLYYKEEFTSNIHEVNLLDCIHNKFSVRNINHCERIRRLKQQAINLKKREGMDKRKFMKSRKSLYEIGEKSGDRLCPTGMYKFLVDSGKLTKDQWKILAKNNVRASSIY